MKRALVALAMLAALLPVGSVAASTPDPARLRAALADPIDPQFIEVTTPGPGWLVGQFDAQAYADSFTDRDSQSRQQAVVALQQEGFVSGYQREWYKRGSQVWLGEVLLVFKAAAGAESMAQGSKISYAQDVALKGFIPMTDIPNAYALTELSSGGVHWTVVLFTKGNGVFAIAGGSNTDYMTSSILAQAQREFATAPPTLAVAGRTSAAPPVGRNPFVVAGIIGGSAVATAGVVALVLVVVVLSRSRRPMTIAMQTSPDGKYWWDGKAWRQVPRQ